jgi:ABC-2 type transport system ATP-binding protein
MSPNAAALRCRIGYLPTTPQFPPQMTPITYLDFVGKLFGLSGEVRKPRLASLLRAVDLLGASSAKLAALSTGMLTRLGIAASLINEPELLIWDEPTGGLDPEARRSTIDLMKELTRHRTLILSSHHLHDVDEVCDHAVVLNQGQLIFQGAMAELKGRLRRNGFELQLEGKTKAVEAVRASLAKLGSVRSAIVRGSRIELELAEGKDVASPLAEVLLTIADSGVPLSSVQTQGRQTEEAFLDLVESDQARGFARATDHQAA